MLFGKINLKISYMDVETYHLLKKFVVNSYMTLFSSNCSAIYVHKHMTLDLFFRDMVTCNIVVTFIYMYMWIWH